MICPKQMQSENLAPPKTKKLCFFNEKQAVHVSGYNAIYYLLNKSNVMLREIF